LSTQFSKYFFTTLNVFYKVSYTLWTEIPSIELKDASFKNHLSNWISWSLKFYLFLLVNSSTSVSCFVISSSILLSVLLEINLISSWIRPNCLTNFRDDCNLKNLALYPLILEKRSESNKDIEVGGVSKGLSFSSQFFNTW
jgi:hypothetical protein